MQKKPDVPEPPKVRKGYYIHFKHLKTGLMNNACYEVTGPPFFDAGEQVWKVPYRALYSDDPLYMMGKLGYVRSAEEFVSKVTYRRERIPRFKYVEEPKFIQYLNTVRAVMYESRPR